MSSEVVVRAESAGKAYAMFQRPEHRLKQMLFGRWRTYYEQFWALKAIDLEIRQGETWGIIGRNGSGKSTLLQMICGNLNPTVGTVTVSGRIAALLELGAGFNPEFTGRENVYTNGIIAGYDRAAVDERMDGILAFADIGPFIDQAVKTYSSGMFARLAFAVAISVDPDLLIVDEALAVGDEAFQRKCFARMERIKGDGATILFVSHATATVVDLCDHAILLHQGEHLYTGRPKGTVAWYQKLMAAPDERIPEILGEIRTAAASSGGREAPTSTDALRDLGFVEARDEADETEIASLDPNLVSVSTLAFDPLGAEISDARLLTLTGERVNCLVPGERYKFCYRVSFTQAVRAVKFYCMTKVINGVHLGGGMFPPGQQTIPMVGAGEVIDICFEFDCAFAWGTYFFNCGVASRGELLHRVLDVLAFRVARGPVRPAMGTVDLKIQVEIRSSHTDA
ncbi:ABC transporter ATP-binding protein [uncultured Thiodictyon sp.]|jgi:lipopolysaccharide transport system ATP-binding protein|uniref:ABC transporter ATP-binding protein n=1 Tax=uncultured Thiodictyon sp. TaxID=1846217 RepID=UPI0025F81188|nr:ABC transporter ATP-binding protein [uncultured Thiodictyon sp.]